jgi:hypothetical protein
VILKLLTEGVRQPSEAAHIHPHVEVLPLHITEIGKPLVRPVRLAKV